MAVELSERVREIAESRDVPESEVLERALERGVEDLWIQVVLERYVEGDLDREEAVDLVGRDPVRRADREVEAVEDDVRWGLNA